MQQQRRLGAHGPTVFPIALGCMGMSPMYGPVDENESIATIHAALDRGVNLIDTRQKLVETLRDLAQAKNVTATQVAIAWVMAKNESIVPVMGARTRKQLEESLRALEVTLNRDEIAKIEAAIPADAVAGTRYDAHGMATLDSER